MNSRAIFLCGDRSRYGRAHLEPLCRHFDLQAVITPAPERWQTFYRALRGTDDAPQPRRSITISGMLRRLKALFTRENPAAQLSLESTDAEHHSISDINSPEARDLIKRLKPDYLFAAAYPQIFSAELLHIAGSSINFHPSPLPLFRGAHPHYWTIATGAAEGGVTAHLLTRELDAGDIVAQRRFSAEGLYYSELYDRIVQETPALVQQVRTALDSGEPFRTQEHAAATVFRNDREIHHRIFWQQMSARQVWNIIRTERAFCYMLNRRLNIHRADLKSSNRHMTNDISVPAGTVVDVRKDSFVVAARSGFLNVTGASTGSSLQSIGHLVRHAGLRIGVFLS